MYCVARCPCGRLSIALFSSRTHRCICGKRFELRPKNERRILFAGDHISCREFLYRHGPDMSKFTFRTEG